MVTWRRAISLQPARLMRKRRYRASAGQNVVCWTGRYALPAGHPAAAEQRLVAGRCHRNPSATRRAQQTQQQVLASLSAWQNRADDERIATIRAVATQTRSLRIVGRQFISLDPDAVRTDARGDRSLEGRYDLWVSPAPRTVTLMGAVATPGKLAWRPGASIRDYLQGQLRLAGADRNNVTVIDPDGSTVVAPVAYWNARHIEAEPGAVLWVGFDPRAVPDDFTGLNEQIVALLTRRIPD